MKIPKPALLKSNKVFWFLPPPFEVKLNFACEMSTLCFVDPCDSCTDYCAVYWVSLN